MKIAILTANLNSFDKQVDPVKQELPKGSDMDFYRFTDSNFPPITVAMSSRFQYRIPKMFGWELKRGYQLYVWLDGSMSLQLSDSLRWFMEQMGDNEMLFFQHPWRKTIKEEVDFIDDYLNRRSGTKRGQNYLIDRYKNGLHKECYDEIMKDEGFVDNRLFASTVFAYKNTKRNQEALKDWWFWQSRYWSCDQIPLPYVLWKNKIKVKTIEENVFNFKYLTLISKHK